MNLVGFDSYWDALMAACPLMPSMPGATAGREDSMGFREHWQVSTEYCAWLYYTPDDKYEISMLAEGPEPLLRTNIKIKQLHGKLVETKEGRIPVGIVAYFSNSYAPQPTTCDGFFEYNLGSTEVMKWMPDGNGNWRAEKAGTVTWANETEFEFKPEKK